MTADEYKEMHEKIERYEELNNVLETLLRHKENCKSGVISIRPVGWSTIEDVMCGYSCMGDGFQELATQKVIEAFDEQISRIEKQMEEL